MKVAFQNIFRFFFLSVFVVTAFLAACAGKDTPTEAYKRLYAAVKSKDTESIKRQLSQKTISLAEMSGQRFNKTNEQVFENGMTATTFSDTLPPMRDERVKDNMGALEVWNSKDKKWEDVPFVFEDGAWKLAIGEGFAGTYERPGMGRDFREKEAANAVSNSNVIIVPPNANLAGNRPANSK